MDRGAWRATLHGVTKSQTQLRNLHFYSQVIYKVVLVSSVQQSDIYIFFFSDSFPTQVITNIFKFTFNWKIICLQCCVGFCYTT